MDKRLYLLWVIVLIVLANAIFDWAALVDPSLSDTFRWPGFIIIFIIALIPTIHSIRTKIKAKENEKISH
jgi:hypothetical protein